MIDKYLESLIDDKDALADNLIAKGISGLTGDETFTELVPEVLNIPSGGGSEPHIIVYNDKSDDVKLYFKGIIETLYNEKSFNPFLYFRGDKYFGYVYVKGINDIKNWNRIWFDTPLQFYGNESSYIQFMRDRIEIKFDKEYDSQNDKITVTNITSINYTYQEDLNFAAPYFEPRLMQFTSSSRNHKAVLGIRNTETYNPNKGSYNPATAKYVDTNQLKVLGLSEYDANSTYNTGDYAYYGTTVSSETTYTIYKCNEDNVTGTFDNTKWTAMTYLEYLKEALAS